MLGIARAFGLRGAPKRNPAGTPRRFISPPPSSSPEPVVLDGLWQKNLLPQSEGFEQVMPTQAGGCCCADTSTTEYDKKMVTQVVSTITPSISNTAPFFMFFPL